MTIGVILAGGRSTRMGFDKAFAHLHGRALIEHAIACLAPQVTRLVINSNRDHARFARYGLPVFADAAPGVCGPLAGIYTALTRWPNDAIVTVAVDLPFLPTDLVQRLCARNRICRYASADGRHALAIGWAPHSASALADYLAGGRRDLYGWLQDYGDGAALTREQAFNINTPQALSDAERMNASNDKLDAA